MPKKLKHILVIRLSAMGDVAMTVPVLRALTQQYTDVKITILTRSFFKPFFRDLPNVSVFTADVKGVHKGLYGLYKLAKALDKENFYVVADLHNVLRSKVLKGFLSYKRFISIDKGRKEKRGLTTGKLFTPLKTTHQRYAEVFEILGYPIHLEEPIFPKKIILDKSTRLFYSDKRKNIGIAPFAAHASKMYPLDLMKEVIEELSKDYNIILFGGGKHEENVLNDFESVFKHVVSVVGKLNLNKEMDLISNLDVMLSMDSGNAHIAAMLGIKVVTIWGVTHPYAGFIPFNQPEDYQLLSDRTKFPLIPTSVYGNKYPEAYKNAAGSILPETIVKKIKSII
jgi:ADP-heptose:LPS heptosyltransferase